jgi:hypothetical protein
MRKNELGQQEVNFESCKLRVGEISKMASTQLFMHSNAKEILRQIVLLIMHIINTVTLDIFS